MKEEKQEPFIQDNKNLVTKQKDSIEGKTLYNFNTLFLSYTQSIVNISSSSDRKAYVLISTSGVYLGLLISLSSYRNISETNPIILLPITLMIVTCLITFSFSLIAIKPFFTYSRYSKNYLKKGEENPLFFGNFMNQSKEEYRYSIFDALTDHEYLKSTMIDNIFFMRKLLARKNYYLNLAFSILIVGFIISILFFLVVIFL